ncbi:MAG: 3-phosphoshikimate 1-carboxyvinyltransferase [Proteobacteria bacterium]|nr:3-phosphoshikimate 1-carboxyvinyltransferase [Pseudomonadota bacterium]MDA1357489.1 3-phosphoshikimate 1-carboxyvinyltransferase [Pseudomonadota bacterium]
MSENQLDSGAPGAPPDAAKSAKADHHFVRKFASSMPAHIAETFTDAQLRAIIRAYGVRSWSQHAIDFRFTLPILARTYYFVFLAGIDKRPRSRNRAERHSHPMATLGNVLFLFFVLLLLLSFVLGAFYVLKSAFGLNIAPGFSLGVWDNIQSQVGGK